MNRINHLILEHAEANFEKIAALWGQVKILAPIFYGNFEANHILYVGLNPSFDLKAIKRYDSRLNREDFYFSNLLENKKREVVLNAKIDRLINIQNELKNHETGIAYFRTLNDFHNKIESTFIFQHIDLFQFRGTNQREVKIILKGESNIYRKEGLELFDLLIKIINPKIIIVFNAYASSILKKHWALYRKKNDFFYTKPNDKTIVYLGAQLSGGVTSIYDRERLELIIRNKIKKNF